MEEVLFRFLIVWVSLHIILFFVEMYRYKYSNWSWYGFKRNGMLNITCVVLAIDRMAFFLSIAMGIIYWILQPIII